MVGWYRCGVVLPVEGMLCDSVGGVYSIEARFNQLVIRDCTVGKYFLVRVGVSPCIM